MGRGVRRRLCYCSFPPGEEALRNRHEKTCERLTEHTRQLPPLQVGDCVRIQNQRGINPTKWDRSGVIVEVKQYDQYVVRVDGSGRVTLRNRKFLRKYIPVVPRDSFMFRPGPVVNPKRTESTPSQSPHSVKPAVVKPSTPPRIDSSIYTRSRPDTTPPVDLQLATPTPAVQQTGPPSPQTQNIQPGDTSLASPTDRRTNTSEQMRPGATGPLPTTPVTTRTGRKPLILKQLDSYNAPGLHEKSPQQDLNTRVTRQSSRR